MSEDDSTQQIRAVAWTLASVSVAVVGLRLYCRLALTKKPGWDDFWMVFALVNALICSALGTVGTIYGLGKHLADIKDPELAVKAIKYTVIPAVFCVISSTAGKIAIVIFLFRLLGQAVTRLQKWLLWSMTAVMVVYNIFAIILIIGFCIPTAKIWDPRIDGKCMPLDLQKYGGMSQASYNALMDLMTAILPALMISTLQMKTSTKWGLTFLMGGGVFAAAATLVKVYMLKDIGLHSDFTWAWADITIWYTAEMYAVIIGGSIPTFRPLFSRIAHGKFSTNQSDGVDNNRERSWPGFSRLGRGRGQPIPKGMGQTTVELNEIDEATIDRRNSHTDGSSVENMLPTKHDQDGSHRRLREVYQGHSGVVSAAPPSASPQSDQIRVTTEVSVRSPHNDMVEQAWKQNPYFPHQDPFNRRT